MLLLLAHPNAHSSQAWTRQKPGDGNTTGVSHTLGPSRCLLPAGCASTGMWHQRQRRDCDSGPVRGCAHSRSRLLSRKPATEIRFGDSAGREVLRAQVPQIHEVPGSAKPAQTLLQQLPCAGHGPECSPVSAPESCTDPRTRSSPHPSHRWGD